MTLDVHYLELNLTGYGTHGLRLAKANGHRTHLVSRSPEDYRRLDPDPLPLLDSVTTVDTYDLVKLMYHFSANPPQAVIAFDDYRVVQAAMIAEQFGLPGAAVAGILNCRFKDLARRRTAGIGRQPAWVTRPVDRPGDTSPIGYPCVVKPIDDSASTGVHVCCTDEEYRAAFGSAIDHATHARGYRCVERLLVEEYLEGPEFSAELVWDGVREEWAFVGLTRKLTSGPPLCYETGHVFPYSLGYSLDAEIRRTVLAWLAAVGHRNGAAHVEFRLVDGVPALMEINPRVGGDRIRDLVERALGIDLIDLYQSLYTGAPRPVEIPDTKRFAAVRFIAPSRLDGIRGVRGPNDPGPGVVSSLVSAPAPGSKPLRPGSRLGHVLTEAADPGTALAIADEFADGVRIEYS